MSTKSFLFVFCAISVSWLGCQRNADDILFASLPARLDDYDFTKPRLDGIPPERIESFLLPSGDNGARIHVIFVSRDVRELDSRLAPEDRITVLFSHGTGGNMLWYWYRLAFFEDMGFNVLMYDYRGYGASEGITTEEHIYQDVASAYDYLRDREDVGTIVAAGFSMGGAATLWLGNQSDRPVAACFTEAAFENAQSFIDDHLDDTAVEWQLESEMDNLSRARSLSLPYLLMHGTIDDVVPPYHGHDLWDAAQNGDLRNRAFFVKGAGHDTVPVPSYNGHALAEYSHPDELPANLRREFNQDYKARINDFLSEVL
ncbi:MAG: alpha/beta fold hydrolase [Myxococcota bacterium]|nr:alpha/beta fold hydrolase [Myxococcota bacterium]